MSSEPRRPRQGDIFQWKSDKYFKEKNYLALEVEFGNFNNQSPEYVLIKFLDLDTLATGCHSPYLDYCFQNYVCVASSDAEEF